MSKRYFERGGRGVFTCKTCDRSTRRTTQPGDSQLCGDCDELAMTENSVLDGTAIADIAKFRDDMVEYIVRKGGNRDKLRASFATLWKEKGTD